MPAPSGAPKKPVPPSIEAIHVVHDLLDALVESPDLPPPAITAAVANVCGVLRPLISTHRAIAACAYRAVHLALYGYDCKGAGVPNHLHASKRTMIAWRVALSLVLPAAMRSRARATRRPAVPPLQSARADAVLPLPSGDLRAEDPEEDGRPITTASASDHSASTPESLSANPLHVLADAALADPTPYIADRFYALANAVRPTSTTDIRPRPSPAGRTIKRQVGAGPSEASITAARHLLTEIGRSSAMPPPHLTVALAAAFGYQDKGTPTGLRLSWGVS